MNPDDFKTSYVQETEKLFRRLGTHVSNSNSNSATSTSNSRVIGIRTVAERYARKQKHTAIERERQRETVRDSETGREGGRETETETERET